MSARDEAIKELARRELARRAAPINPVERAAQVRALPADQREMPSEMAARSPLGNLPQSRGGSFMSGAADTGGIGFADEAGAAVGSMLTGNSYGDTLKEMRDIRAGAQEQNPKSFMGGQVAGAVAPFLLTRGAGSPLLTGVARPGASLGGRMAAGASAGAIQGGAYGVGSGEGLVDRLAQGVGGAVMGGGIGGSVPLLATTVKSVFKPAIDAVKARMNPAAFADKKVFERLAAGGATPDVVATKMARNPGAAVADTAGKSARDLLRTTVNVPGAARDRVATQVAIRQMGQGDRLREAVKTTLADPDGYLTAKDRIADTMKRISKPLYDRFEKSRVPINSRLLELINTPAGKAALRHAQQLSANERVQFTKNMEITPSGWDYIKKALDDMVDGQTDSITKKVTNEGRVLVGLKNDLLAELDRINPYYKPAREAWGGIKQLDDALEFGRKALTMTGEQIKRATAKYNAGQKMSMRIGAAEALRKDIDRAGFTNNAVLNIMNSRQRYGALRSLFDNSSQFAEFRRTLLSEARKRKTYDAVRGNSTTAAQLADMAEAGGTNELATFGLHTATSGPVSATLNWVGSRLRRLGGLTPQVADQIARRLMTTNPAQAQALVAQLQKIEAAKLSAQQRATMIQSMISRVLTAPAVSAASGS